MNRRGETARKKLKFEPVVNTGPEEEDREELEFVGKLISSQKKMEETEYEKRKRWPQKDAKVQKQTFVLTGMRRKEGLGPGKSIEHDLAEQERFYRSTDPVVFTYGEENMLADTEAVEDDFLLEEGNYSLVQLPFEKIETPEDGKVGSFCFYADGTAEILFDTGHSEAVACDVSTLILSSYTEIVAEKADAHSIGLVSALSSRIVVSNPKTRSLD